MRSPSRQRTLHRGPLAAALMIAAAIIAVPALASAAAVQADFNDLNTGAVPGQAGGSGWTGNWIGSTNITVIAGDLAPDSSTNYGLTQSGTAHSIQGTSNGGVRVNRYPAASLTGTVWFSFLVNQNSTNSRAGLEINPPDTSGSIASSTTDARLLAVGGDLYVLLKNGAGLTNFAPAGNGLFTVGSTSLVLGEIQIDGNGANDVLSIWIDPDVNNLGAADFTKNDLNWIASSQISLIGLESYGNSTSAVGGKLDEINLSDTATAYHDVTGNAVAAVPTPAALPAGLALLGLAAGRRKRRLGA